MKITLNQIKKEVIKVTNAQESSKEFMPSVVLFSSAFVGPSIKRLAKFCHCPRKEVADISKNLRKSKIWVGRKVNANWFDKKEGGIAFCMDSAVAMGWMSRKP